MTVQPVVRDSCPAVWQPVPPEIPAGADVPASIVPAQSSRQQHFLKNVMQHKVLPVSCACGILPHLISVLPILYHNMWEMSIVFVGIESAKLH